MGRAWLHLLTADRAAVWLAVPTVELALLAQFVSSPFCTEMHTLASPRSLERTAVPMHRCTVVPAVLQVCDFNLSRIMEESPTTNSLLDVNPVRGCLPG
jgi:hypothetical protein